MYRKVMYEKYLSAVNITEEEIERNFSQNIDYKKRLLQIYRKIKKLR